MVARRYEISLLVLANISFASEHTCEVIMSSRESSPCILLAWLVYIYIVNTPYILDTQHE